MKKRVIPIDWAAIRQRLKEARAPLAQAKFAKLLGFSQSEVSEWERGPRRPSSEYVSALSREIGISLDWLFWGLAPKYVSDKNGKLNNELDDLKGLLENTLSRVNQPKDLPGVRILSPRDFKQPPEASEFYALPLYGDAVAAGTPREVEDASAEGVAIIHKNWCPNPGASFFIRAKGDSMEPTIPDGAFVCVDAAVRDAAKLLGRIVVIAVDAAGATIKRLQKTERGDLIGLPDHLTPDNRPINIKEGDRIIGLVRSVHAEVK